MEVKGGYGTLDVLQFGGTYHGCRESPKYLSDTVKRLTGYSVTHLIDRHTLPIIISFLEDDRLTLNQISDEMNFSSLSYFTRYCTKHLGMTPTKYRNSSNTLKI